MRLESRYSVRLFSVDLILNWNRFRDDGNCAASPQFYVSGRYIWAHFLRIKYYLLARRNYGRELMDSWSYTGHEKIGKRYLKSSDIIHGWNSSLVLEYCWLDCDGCSSHVMS